MMRRTTSFVVVLWLLFVAEIGVEKCRGWVEEAVEDVKNNASAIAENANLDEKAEAVKKGASEVYNDAKDSAGSWSNWAYEKISKGLGLNEEELKETAHYMVDKAGDAAAKTTQTISTAASGASEYASEKAGEAAKVAGDLKSKSENVVTAASEKVSDAKTNAKETFVKGKDKAAEAFEAAKNEVEEKVAAAKECVNCEAAKETASQTAAEIGARIRERTAEL